MEKTPSGFPCPKCGTASLVYSTKQHANTSGWSTRRYRKCEQCHQRFTTVELLLIKDEE
jgi:transcriptional regulator NrdR family protein